MYLCRHTPLSALKFSCCTAVLNALGKSKAEGESLEVSRKTFLNNNRRHDGVLKAPHARFRLQKMEFIFKGCYIYAEIMRMTSIWEISRAISRLSLKINY